MENEPSIIKEEDYIVIKELILSREKILKYQLSGVQNGIVNFCKNYNMFQNKTNFFNMTLKEQFEFNECIEYTGGKIKKDYKEIENFYTKCKTKCLADNNFRVEEIEEKINQYNEASIELTRPSLHPCIDECIGMYHYMADKYYLYMIKNSGIYVEFIDYKKYVV